MSGPHPTRRGILRAAALGAGASLLPPEAIAAETVAVPHSAGTAPPRLVAPAGACDSHIHIADARFSADFPARFFGATLADYRLLQRRIGTRRAVIVQTKIHGMDHSCLIDALRQMGPDGRGIGVLPPDTPMDELKRLDAAGIRGLRFSVWNPADAVTTLDMVAPAARRIADLGWHIQLHAMGDQIADAGDMLARLPCPLVIDHMGRLPPGRGITHPAYRRIRRLLDSGRTWLKLSGAYLNTKAGPPCYTDATRIADAFCRANPERLVWGSDWPHATEAVKPDDALLFDLLASWAPDAETRRRILVANPEALYGFEPAR
jgi:predicted TIM-barrel fold metal-dependent hydrolase